MVQSRLGFIFLLLSLVVSSYAVNIEGLIDIYPAGFIADRSTPFAIHFSCWNNDFWGHAAVTTKLRIFSDTTTVINYTWSTAIIPYSWRWDEQVPNLHNPIPVANNTVSGWLYGMSRSVTYFGLTTAKIRIYITSPSVPYDIITTVPLYAWNTTTDAGWIEGIYPAAGAKSIVLAKDSSGRILGSYITEDNGVTEQPVNYDTTVGYFKLGVPVGKIATLEFRNLSNQTIATYSGPWTVTAGKITNIGSPTNIEKSQWRKY
jgi:hypothetical protein